MSVDEPYAPYLARYLAPGERVVAACSTKMALGKTPSRAQSRGGWRFVESALDAAAPSNWMDWLLFGRAVGGAAGSTAAKVHRPWSCVLARTDQRLLWCRLTGPPLGHWSYRGPGGTTVRDDLLELITEVTLGGVAGARVGRHRLRTGRLWIIFADGSWLAFSGGWSRRACHERMAAAINH